MGAPTSERHHGGTQGDCGSCHTGDKALPDPGQTAYCQRCHEGRTPTSKQTAALTDTQAAASDDLSDAGMHGPTLYKESRFGLKPGEMVHIPEGSFVMGSNARLADESPEYIETVKAYWIDRYEVTNLQYKAFIDATGHRSPSHFRNRTYPEGKVDHPVTFVSWYDARDYCASAGKRLPTEEEWEKAGRGTDGRTYPWGNDFDISRANTPVRWAALKRQGDTSPIGAFPSGVSPYGLEDMSGNVWEWTESWYMPHPGNKQPSENYGQIYKVLKGGSWWDCSFYKCGISAPVYNRSFFNPHVRNSSFGFRCARDEIGAEAERSKPKQGDNKH